MENYAELSPEEFGERLNVLMSFEKDYDGKAKFIAVLHRLLTHDQDDQFKNSPEHANVLKEFISSFFVKRNPDGSVDEEATREAIREYNEWKVETLSDYAVKLHSNFSGFDTLRGGLKMPVEYLDTVAEEALQGTEFADFMQTDLEEKVNALDERDKMYYSKIEEKEASLLKENDFPLEYLMDDRRKMEGDNNYDYDQQLKNRLLVDNDVVRTAKENLEKKEQKRAEERALAEERKRKEDYEAAAAEVTEFDEEIEACNAKMNSIGQFMHSYASPIRDKAFELFQRIDEMYGKKSYNSAEFTNMYNCLVDVNNERGSGSFDKMTDNLIKLRQAAEAYAERIDSSIFRGVLSEGKKRRELATELMEFAAESTKLLDVNKPAELDSSLSISGQVGDAFDRWGELRDARERAIQERIAEKNALSIPKVAPETIVSYPKAEPKNITSVPKVEAENINSFPKVKLDTLHREEAVEEPAEHAAAGVRNKTDLTSLMNEQKEEKKDEKKLSPREEALQKRDEIMQKRRENEKAGIANDGWDARRK